MTTLERDQYLRLYGPTVGDRVRLADTGLVVEVERDDTEPGDEPLGGCGKTLREGMLVTSRANRDSRLDLVITNVVVLDPVLGVRKTSIGVKDGRIVGVGRAGSPDTVDGVDLTVDAHTAIVPGEGLIATPGGVDSHVHLSSTAVLDVALASGITTVVGMGSGGVWDVGVNPAHTLRRMVEAWRDVPLNVSFLARGSAVHPGLLEEAMGTGASGFKVHEDFGAQPAVIDTCLDVAEHHDVAVALHTDSLNESGMLADTLDATRGRTVHAYHVEGGGGHPNLLEILAWPHVLASSTTPTIPYTVNTTDELFPMTMTVHRQNKASPGDVETTRSRIRAQAIAAENVLHDLGAVSILNSDSMGMGRIGEVWRRLWQLAGYLRETTGGPHRRDRADAGGHDNDRVLQFLAKVTLNPALAHGLAHEVGALLPGRLADVVLWQPAWFGAKPELVLKSGFVAWGVSGSGAGSTRLSQPRRYRAFFGGTGGAPASLSVVFVAEAALDDPAGVASLPAGRRYVPVRGARGLTRADMMRNTAVPQVHVPHDGSPVQVDGLEVTVTPARHLPLTQRFHLG